LHPVVRAETRRSAVSIGVVSKRSIPQALWVTRFLRAGGYKRFAAFFS
jgi:hypothetical protein